MEKAALALCLLIVLPAPLFSLLQSGLMLARAESSIPTPSVPVFTVKFMDNFYDVATTYSIDLYTGETVTHPGYHVSRVTLQLIIKNQPFTPYEEGGWKITLQYNVRIKGHYSENWTELYRPSDGCLPQSDYENTAISLGSLGENGLSIGTNTKMINAPSGSQVDFQVEALIGYNHRAYNSGTTDHFEMYPWVFTGTKSGWSNTQTITVPASSAPSPSPTPTPKPSVPEFTVKLVDHSYIVPPTATIDPYTGQQKTNPGYTVENKTIDITVKNQQFSPPDNLTNLYYGVRVKGHFEEDWRELYYITNSTNGNNLLLQSASENTVISIPQDYPQGGQADFQVEAVIATAHPLFSYDSNFGYWTWETSGWSNTQTVTIGTDSGFKWTEISLFAAFGIIIALLIAVPFIRRRQTKK